MRKFMIKQIDKQIDKQRSLLEQYIKQIGNLTSAKIVAESQKLDMMLNEYTKANHSYRPCK
ncbi:aspartyl-phosphate phosphatase Spo0E family protein [Clostridium tyrobutyricum]|uniref:aspartyl-phosphate phosphatase Spo0E family protein n=1 Tax=Clostridium tyrobutyricum TaxID=1519 RepID=UPI001C394869|nr:aspartyl-phosphate phosphatase Spo0E family protein [Clostridium tyrobutyricum]MBV4421677.1 aspartyl-phosphate phosphatase Spo0E family protein [Clostridium tyrobutyricum]